MDNHHSTERSTRRAAAVVVVIWAATAVMLAVFAAGQLASTAHADDGTPAPMQYRNSARVAHIRWVSHHIRPCRFEDSRNCYWDAGAAGNGHGRSFVDLNGRAYYLDGGK